jgi:hypothetical protein
VARNIKAVRLFQEWTTKLYICPDCGTREALESIGVDEKEQEEILATIHSHTR